MSQGEPKVLLEECSPNGNIWAIVEEDAACSYFYLRGEEETKFGFKSCWVRNHFAAPEHLDKSVMEAGGAPMLPRQFCRYPEGAPRLDPQSLRIVWAEEGDAAALKERDEIIAIIPSWSGIGGFHGYARDCIGDSPVAWELGPDNAQIARYEEAERSWRAWDEGTVWSVFQPRMLEAIESQFGKHSNYYAIDSGKWPPKALLRIRTTDAWILITIGMALRPQPKVELSYEDPSPYRRVELAVSLSPNLSDDDVMEVAVYMSAQSDYPWSAYTFLGDGHTMRSDEFEQISEKRLRFALMHIASPNSDKLVLPHFRGDPINILWLTPISEREQLYAMEIGSSKLAEQLGRTGYDWAHDFQRSGLNLQF